MAPVCGLPALFARISSKPGRFFGWGTATSKFEFGLAFFFQLLIVKAYDRAKPAVQVEMAIGGLFTGWLNQGRAVDILPLTNFYSVFTTKRRMSIHYYRHPFIN